MTKREQLIKLIKKNKVLDFESKFLKALIKTLKSDEYNEYYYIKHDFVENANHYLVHLNKNVGKKLLFIFEVIIYENQKRGIVKYACKGEVTTDYIMFKWLCDLLSDQKLIKKYI